MGLQPALTSAPRRLLLISSAVVVTIALLATGLVLTATNWSTLMKMLPAPRVERIVLEGDAATGTVIDCRGEWFNEGKPTELVIRSRQTAAGWERPENVVIRNCRIRGSIRIMGMSRNGEGDEVRKSSVSPGHTERVQAAAPTKILISDVEIEADYRIPLYVAPGVTNVTFERSRITGWGCSTAVYLDCESGGNVIRDNTFAMRQSREVIAIDGSARNRIEDNRFENLAFGGILLYRNCGEAGTVRHQTPHGNVIAGNVFDTRTLGLFAHAIWLGSRNGRSNYCHQDDGYPFGSSSDNRDFANDNEVRNNRFEPPSPRAIRDDGAGNVISP
jgi:hypothetical protein